MNSSKILFIGNFGTKKSHTNGQAVKTLTIFRSLERQVSKRGITQINTAKRIGCFLRLFWLRTKRGSFTDVVMLPAQNGVKIIPRICLRFFASPKTKLHYILIGGWLPDLLAGTPSLINVLGQLDYLYSETRLMRDRLTELGLKNVVVMPNYKVYETDYHLTRNPVSNDGVFRFVLFSRLTPEKGIDLAIQASEIINQNKGQPKVELHLYGPVSKADERWFAKAVESHSAYVKYHGCANADLARSILSGFFALLFPTYYPGEGFPGTIIDAFSSGIPVIASDWKYNCEIVKDGETGYIFKALDASDLAAKMLLLINAEPLRLKLMKKAALRTAEKYSETEVLPILTKRMNWRSP